MRILSDQSISAAVEITKVAVAPTGPGTHHIGNGEAASGVTSKPAICGQGKTGQRGCPRT
jgi:hypothetical protein